MGFLKEEKSKFSCYKWMNFKSYTKKHTPSLFNTLRYSLTLSVMTSNLRWLMLSNILSLHTDTLLCNWHYWISLLTSLTFLYFCYCCIIVFHVTDKMYQMWHLTRRHVCSFVLVVPRYTFSQSHCLAMISLKQLTSENLWKLRKHQCAIIIASCGHIGCCMAKVRLHSLALLHNISLHHSDLGKSDRT